MGRGRAPCCDKTQVKKGPWSPAEDLRLINFVQRNGHDNWRSLPKLAGLARCGKSCRLRWINYLHPDVKRGNFTSEEEDTIMRLHESMGNKWAKIASCLPGRTDNEIKNVWNTHLKKRAKHMKKSKEECDQSSSKNVSASTSSSSLASSSSSSSCKNPSCEQNINKDHIVKDLSDRSSSLSSSIMSCDESNVVTNLKSSCHDHNKTITSPSSSEEVNKPLEADFDFWSMLDMDNLGCNYFQSNDEDLGFVGDYCSKEDEQKKWLKNLETELGLEVMCDDDDLLMMKPQEDDHVLGNLVNSQVWPSPHDSYII